MVPPKYDECLQVAESHGTGTGVREETDEARERDRGGGGCFAHCNRQLSEVLIPEVCSTIYREGEAISPVLRCGQETV